MADKQSSIKSTIFSNTDLVLVLETRIPVLRALHTVVRDIFEEVVSIDPQVLVDTDKCLRRRFKETKKNVTRQVNEFTNFVVGGYSFNEVEFDHNSDFHFLYLTFASAQAKTLAIFEEVCTSYEMPYQIVCSRIAGKTVLAEELQNLHLDYGVFVQALLKYREKHKAFAELLALASDHNPHFEAIADEAVELMAACTDMNESLMVLNDTHHKGLDYVRYAKLAA